MDEGEALAPLPSGDVGPATTLAREARVVARLFLLALGDHTNGPGCPACRYVLVPAILADLRTYLG